MTRKIRRSKVWTVNTFSAVRGCLPEHENVDVDVDVDVDVECRHGECLPEHD